MISTPAVYKEILGLIIAFISPIFIRKSRKVGRHGASFSCKRTLLQTKHVLARSALYTAVEKKQDREPATACFLVTPDIFGTSLGKLREW